MAINLTTSQETILRTLINLAHDDELVKARMIAEEIDRDPGTIRNQMQSFKTLGLVESVAGPDGGYKPTATAYETLDVESIDTAVGIPVYHDGDRRCDITVTEVDFVNVLDPERCRVELYVRGPLRDISEGDRIEIGPTPNTELVIGGVVGGKDVANGVIILHVETMSAPGTTAACAV